MKVPDDPLSKKETTSTGMFLKSELTLLILQALDDLGYQKSFSVLQEESSLLLETDSARRFREAVLSASWTEALAILDGCSGESSKSVRFVLYREHFKDLLRGGRRHEALAVLRDCITPMFEKNDDHLEKVKDLASMLVHESLSSSSSVKEESSDKHLQQLQVLFDETIQPQVPPETLLLLPRHRMERLLGDAFPGQTEWPVSLLASEKRPLKAVRSIEAVTFLKTSEQLWAVDLSSSYIAAGCKDGTVCIWKSFKDPPRLLKGGGAITRVQFSPSGELLLTASTDGTVQCWRVADGQPTRTFGPVTNHQQQHYASIHERRQRRRNDDAGEETSSEEDQQANGQYATDDGDPVSCLAWMKDSRGFVIGRPLTGSLIIYRCTDDDQWHSSVVEGSEGLNATDMAIHGDHLAVADGNRGRLVVWKWQGCTFTPFITYQMGETIMILSVSLLSSWIICSTAQGNRPIIYCWKLPEEPAEPARPPPDCKYSLIGHFHSGRYLVGGSSAAIKDQIWVLTGSEDSLLYGWRIDPTQSQGNHLLLPSLTGVGHTAMINRVAVAVDGTIVTASDDGSVGIWHL